MSGAEVKARLKAALIPVGAVAGATVGRSDYDLNPETARNSGALTEAAVLIGVIAREAGPTVLLTRRADTLARHTGQIAFPGGRVDPGEGAVEAALREAFEEVALDPAAVEVLGLCEPYETVTGYRITPVVGWIAEPPVLRAQEAEVAEVFETPWAFLMDAANHQRESMAAPDGAAGGEARRWFWAMPWGERYIWGATAGMLRALHERVCGTPVEDAA